jgi:phospholipase A2
MFGSAFAASLVHFYQEIRGFLPDGSIDKLDEAVSQYEKSMSSYHPISPSSFPNPFYKIAANHHDVQRPESLVESENIYLMDAGMDNNIPFYPLLRKGRDVDVIIAIDISADIQTAPHFSRAESYMKRRGIEGWPTGAGWPKEKVTVTKEVEPKKEEKILEQFKKAASWTNIESILSKKKQEKAQETQLQKKKITREYPLGSCTIFSGESTEQDDGGSKRKKKNVTLAYFPFIVNKSYDPDFDPQVEEFCATWNFVYTPEQVKKVAGLAEANWIDNQDKIKEVLRETWEKKRRERRGY